MPGRLETFDLDERQWTASNVIRLSDWIKPERLLANRGRTIDDLADELDAILKQCALEMAPRERNYAAVVSGGVDSSLLASYFTESRCPDMFVAVDHVGKDRISSDLSGFENILGKSIVTLKVDAPAYACEIERCQKVSGGPLYSHSFVPQSIQAAHVRANGCRILIGGEGGDELFGGYPAYLATGADEFRYSPSPYTGFREPGLDFTEDDPSQFASFLEAAWKESLDAYSFINDRNDLLILAMTYCDAAYQLSSVGLRGADLMSMMWSVETRSVYVRRPIVEFALNLPAGAKVVRNGNTEMRLRTKPVLKQLFLRRFPGSLLFDKQGFAGFPNEAGKFLGDYGDFIALDFLGIDRRSLPKAAADRDTSWKLINVEYFLRNNMK